MSRREFLKLSARLAAASTIPFVAKFVCAGTTLQENAPIQRTYAEMLAHGEVRMAVPYDRTTYVDAKYQILGISPFIADYLGRFLSEKYKKNIRITIVPTVPGQLVNAIDSGRADFGNGYVDQYATSLNSSRYIVFPHPYSETHVLVSNGSEAPISNLNELSGRIVCLGRQTTTSVFENLNSSLEKSAKNPIHVYQDRLVLDDEDLLQMLDAGLVPYVYVSLWKANLWKPLLKNIRINEETESPGNTPGGFFVIGENKALSDDIIAFISSPLHDITLNAFRNSDFKYRENALKNPTTEQEWTRYKSMRPYFNRYGPEYSLDPLFVAAIGFQESMLDQRLVSRAGAVGVMQLLPATGASMKVGDIYKTEPNIQAGAKYLSYLLKSMTIDDHFTRIQRALFATAAYNAGAGNIHAARELAKTMGFDPDKWFFNVEMASAKMMGPETFLYVRNAYKYFVTYDVLERNALLVSDRFIIDTEPSK